MFRLCFHCSPPFSSELGPSQSSTILPRDDFVNCFGFTNTDFTY